MTTVDDHKPKAEFAQKSENRLGILPFDPLFVWIGLIYALTRAVEWIVGTDSTWQKLWVALVDYSGADEYDFKIWVTAAAMLSVYWLAVLPFLIFDFTGWFRKYKVQPGTNEPPDTRKLLEAFFTVLFNQIAVSILFSSGGFYTARAYLGEQDIRAVASFPWLIVSLLICHTLFDVAFYTFHRLMHTKYIYKHIHKIHHEWKAPIGVIAIYAHPVEHLITNLIPPTIGPLLCGASISTFWIWISTVAISTVSDHSGYHFPYLKSPQFHDYHHVSFTECFGSCGIMDYFLKTDTKFRRSVFFRRHRVLLSLKTTINEMYPKRSERIAKSAVDVVKPDDHKE